MSHYADCDFSGSCLAESLRSLQQTLTCRACVAGNPGIVRREYLSEHGFTFAFDDHSTSVVECVGDGLITAITAKCVRHPGMKTST